MLRDFKSFLLRGNVVDLAVAVVIGAAFGSVVTSLVSNLITPLIAAVGGTPDFSGLSFTINHSRFGYGLFLNSLISFLIISAVIFFFVVKPLNILLTRLQSGKEAEPTPKDPQLEVLEEIRDALQKRK
ncbi:MAG TPA: large conductance mechanosensitive channel protein MscL [Candidatus Saccharimonadia bacterium]|nr:large conductance mechanosensitive channel protein MscL [Candidatus Saccharimonadia bacterium]